MFHLLPTFYFLLIASTQGAPCDPHEPKIKLSLNQCSYSIVRTNVCEIMSRKRELWNGIIDDQLCDPSDFLKSKKYVGELRGKCYVSIHHLKDMYPLFYRVIVFKDDHYSEYFITCEQPFGFSVIAFIFVMTLGFLALYIYLAEICSVECHKALCPLDEETRLDVDDFDTQFS